jgi:hypothetical protein
MSLVKFRQLPNRLQCLVALAVLLDGVEAMAFLVTDEQYGEEMKEAAMGLALLEPELRMPYVGTLLRESLRFLGGAERTLS